MKCVNISDFVVITVISADHRYIIHGINKSDAIYLYENSVLDDYGYI